MGAAILCSKEVPNLLHGSFVGKGTFYGGRQKTADVNDSCTRHCTCGLIIPSDLRYLANMWSRILISFLTGVVLHVTAKWHSYHFGTFPLGLATRPHSGLILQASHTLLGSAIQLGPELAIPAVAHA